MMTRARVIICDDDIAVWRSGCWFEVPSLGDQALPGRTERSCAAPAPGNHGPCVRTRALLGGMELRKEEGLGWSPSAGWVAYRAR